MNTPYFPKLAALLPKVKEAEAAFDAADFQSNEHFWAEAKKVNDVLREAVEAFVQDTADRNSRDTLESIYLRRPEGWPFIGGLSYKRLLTACETGRAP